MNANGILQYKNEVEILLRHNLVDILLVSETHITDRSYFKVSMSQYKNHPGNTLPKI